MNPQKISDAHRGDRWIRGVFALTLVIFGVIAVSSYLWVSSYLSNTRNARDAGNLHIRIVDLVASLRDMQRAAGGFVITGDTALLGAFREGAADARLGFEGLRNIHDTSMEEQGELEAIRSTGGQFMAATERAIDFMQDGEPDSARGIMQGGESKRAMERIGAITRDMEKREAHGAAERRSEAESDFNRFLLFRGLGTALNLTLIIGTFIFMRRQIRSGKGIADTLKTSEQRLQTVINSVQEGITFSNAGGRFEVFNQRMTEITGYTVDEANQADDFSRLLYPAPDDHRKALDGVKLLMEQQGPQVSETAITTKFGIRKVLRVTSRMLGQTDRRMFLTTYEDITRKERLEQALRESEEKLRLIFENAQDGINIFEETEDHELRRLVECNPRYAELAGRSREELLEAGTTSGMMVSMSGLNVESIEGGNAFSGSFSWIRPDGKDNIIEYTAMPIEMRGKKYTIGIDRDVTDARKAEHLVHDSQIRYRQLFEASPNPLIVYDAETLDFLEVNPATVKHYGYSTAEFLGMSVKDIHPPEDVPRFVATVVGETKIGERTGNWRHRKKDGTIIQVRIKSHAFDWEGRKARLVLVHDITDLLQIEEELRVQKTYFELLFESAPEGIALLDSNGNARDVNTAFARLFGLSKEELIGHDIVEMIVSQEGKGEVRTGLKAVMSGVNVHLESVRLSRRGQPIEVSVIAVPVDNGRGANMAYVLCQDITQKKRSDREKEDLIRQLQKALAEVKTLGGLLPICAWCKKIRDDQGYYHQIESFIAKHSEATFTHGICPDCREKFDREAGVGVASPLSIRRTG
jgi:PAS domain S-box-containing protein